MKKIRSLLGKSDRSRYLRSLIFERKNQRMDIFQWTGIAVFLLATGFYFFATVLLFFRRLNVPFPSIFGCIFFALLGSFMAAAKNSPDALKLNLVNTITAKSNSIVFLEEFGLVRAISDDPVKNGNDTLYLNFKSTLPWADLGNGGGIYALAASNGIIYISQLFDTSLLSFDGKNVKEVTNLIGNAPHLAVDASNQTTVDGNYIFSTINGTVFANNIPIPGTISPFALCFHGENLYISDDARVLIWRRGKIIRQIGPIPSARRIQVWLDRYLVVVPIRVFSQTKVFDLDGKFVTTIAGTATDLAISSMQLFLTDGTTIRVFEQG